MKERTKAKSTTTGETLNVFFLNSAKDAPIFVQKAFDKPWTGHTIGTSLNCCGSLLVKFDLKKLKPQCNCLSCKCIQFVVFYLHVQKCLQQLELQLAGSW